MVILYRVPVKKKLKQSRIMKTWIKNLTMRETLLQRRNVNIPTLNQLKMVKVAALRPQLQSQHFNCEILLMLISQLKTGFIHLDCWLKSMSWPSESPFYCVTVTKRDQLTSITIHAIPILSARGAAIEYTPRTEQRATY